jgi:SAM-dependent methyltransferase
MTSGQPELLGGRESGDSTGRERWSHNSHYHRVVLAAVPTGAERALDVGCGTGLLTRHLRALVPRVTGIDRDERSIELSRSHPGASDISYLLGDFLTWPFEPGSFDFVCAVASLHHMDAEAALGRMGQLLRPGGALAIVGLAKETTPAGLLLSVPAVVGHRAHLVAERLREGPRAAGATTYHPPTVWPPPTSYRELHALVGSVLPGARFRRHLYWRYSLAWSKPS